MREKMLIMLELMLKYIATCLQNEYFNPFYFLRSPGLLRKVHNKTATAIFTTYKIIWYIKWIGFHYVSTNSKKIIIFHVIYLQVREIPHSWLLLLNVLHQIFLICLPRETRFLTIFKFLLTGAIYQKLCLHD